MKWRVTAGNCDRANSHATRETWIKFRGGVNRRRAALLCTWRRTRTALWARLCESQAATIQAVDNGRRWHGLRGLWSKEMPLGKKRKKSGIGKRQGTADPAAAPMTLGLSALVH